MAPPRADGQRGVNLACVVNVAVDLPSDAQLLARRLIGGLCLATDADVLVAVPPDGPRWEVGIPAREFVATPQREMRRELLEYILFGTSTHPRCRCPPEASPATPRALEAAWFDAVGGQSKDLIDYIAAGAYSDIVLFDLAAPTTIEAVERVPAGTRVAIAPLRTAPLQRLPAVGRAIDAADLILVGTYLERDHLAGLTAIPVFDVGLPLKVTPPADAPVGMPDAYVLIVADWNHPVRGMARRQEAAQLARNLPEVDTVVLTHEFIYPQRWPAPLKVRGGGSRSDLWRWMSGAVAVVDLERRRDLARDVLEAMACAAPVIVAEEGRGRLLGETCGGVIWYRNHADVRAAIDALLDGGLRTAVGRAGQKEVHNLIGDVEGFEGRIAAALTGKTLSR